MKPEHLMLIDIETVPCAANYHSLSEKMQLLWEKKSKLIDKEQQYPAISFSEKAGVYAEFGKIICIGVGLISTTADHSSLRVKTIAGDDEKLLLQDFERLCNTYFVQKERQFCGHNIREFDIPYICRRAFINQIPLPEILHNLQDKKPWENPMLDTMQLWKFGEYKNFTSVDLLATILDIETPKDDIDGSMVAEVYWKEKNLERIVRYCAKDVVTVAQILMRLHHRNLILENDITMVNDNVL
ncbi:MAG: ribonuclease H-like domain-containing protein [Bacteroidetes bacterium]|nr:ribonuclease H-like domain-containing protein [Bacteroidota bacterium]